LSAGWRSDVLKFWFGLDPQQWWSGKAELDCHISERFRELWSQKRQLPASSFLGDPLSALAGAILFDQFPRNMFRGHADQFSTDQLALQIVKGAVDQGFDDELEPQERGFLYMPFQHSEDLADQRRSIQLCTALGEEDWLRIANNHFKVIERFGRFPHRNAMLGRAPRPQEVAAGEVVPW
jgi:uncharacterized protein (DUF924 family)